MPFAYPPAMRRLINELSKLPSIGEKSAVRLAYHLLTGNPENSRILAEAIATATERVRLCQYCYFLSEEPVCAICSDNYRTRNILCVVEKPADVIALERTGGFRGLYHVLHGVWSPLRGVGPEKIKIGELAARLREPQAGDPLALPLDEIVIATGTTVEGDATALYIADSLADKGVNITRIAQGLPKGGELEYADEMTLHLSLQGRRRL